jgi:hypothetical protein
MSHMLADVLLLNMTAACAKAMVLRNDFLGASDSGIPLFVREVTAAIAYDVAYRFCWCTVLVLPECLV